MPSKAGGNAIGAGGPAGYKNNPTGELATSVRGSQPAYYPEDTGSIGNARKSITVDQPAPYILGINEQAEDDIIGQVGKGGKLTTKQGGEPAIGGGKVASRLNPEPGQRAILEQDDGEAGVVQAKAAGDPAGQDTTAQTLQKSISESIPSKPTPGVTSTTDPKTPKRVVFQ